jgi:hypothetical protein
MRKSIHAFGTALALLGVALSAAAQAQDECTILRTQFDYLERQLAQPMTLKELQKLVTDMRAERGTVQVLDPAYRAGDLTALQEGDALVASNKLASLATRLATGCDAVQDPIACANSLVTVGEYALQLADPGGYEAWRLQDDIEAIYMISHEEQLKAIAQRNNFTCPSSGSCRQPLLASLNRQLVSAESIQAIDLATSAAADRDPRQPLFDLLERNIVQQMNASRCGDVPDEVPPEPPVMARVAPSDFGPPSAIPVAARQVPVGGPVLEMDPARDPTSSPRDAVWTKVQPGLMEYRGNGQYGSWTWDELPQSIGPEGALITLTITASTTRTGGWATGIQLRGNARITKPDGSPIDLDLPLNLAPESSGQRSMTVLITPYDGYVGTDVEILVGAFYGAQVRYHYKLVRSAGS